MDVRVLKGKRVKATVALSVRDVAFPCVGGVANGLGLAFALHAGSVGKLGGAF